ncbi:MAG: sulfate reduction electron transfer complex DsrMKJOP subunit DsrJ [bacterium]
MKIYSGGKILIGIVVFFVLAASPFLYNMGKASAKPEPKVDTPEILKLPEAERKCIESKEFMKREHMQLLNDWRDSVIRDGKRIYVSSSGKPYEISLQNTCMRCHSNKKKFCDECHTYMAVNPYCWGCHIAPKEDKS